MPFNADLAKLLLVNRKILLECWPVEKYLLTRKLAIP